MTFTTSWETGLVYADRPWERFAVIDDELLPHLAVIDGMVRFEVANGWARYRLVGQKPKTAFSHVSIWEYVEGAWSAPAAAPGVDHSPIHMVNWSHE